MTTTDRNLILAAVYLTLLLIAVTWAQGFAGSITAHDPRDPSTVGYHETVRLGSASIGDVTGWVVR